jgi:gamma-glutamyltranspeptidase/glutathione hydrolase
MTIRRPALLCLLFSVLCPLLPAQPDRINGRAFATRSPVLGQHGMVCTSQPLATQVGLDILKAGGSAVDAAIAANAALGLMEPVSNGVGGDLFAIVWDAQTQKLYGLNASGRSPLGLGYDQLKAELAKTSTPDHIPPRGFLPISVPGAVDGWFALHGKFGKLPMKDVLAPAIRYAADGFPVTQYIGYLWGIGVRNAQADKFPGAFLEVYAPGGQAPKEGEVFKNPALAHTLRLLAEQGRDVFYKGEIADKIDAFMRADLGRARVGQLPRLRCLRAAAQLAGHRGAPDVEHPGGLRPEGHGLQLARCPACDD